MEAAIDAGADDAVSDDVHTVTCAFESIGEVSAALAAKFGEAEIGENRVEAECDVAIGF